MKLTNQIRDAFIRAAMNDVPSIDYNEQIRVAVQADAVAQLPPKVKALHKDASLRHFVKTVNWGHWSNRVTVPSGDDGFKLTPEAEAKVAALQQADNEQTQSRQALRERLRQVAYSVSTRKALVDALPEFEKYLPADQQAAVRTLPVVANVVAEFVKAGWPKGKKREAVAA